ncbi:MAG: CoA pyrophosphatase [Acidobacteriota bacterium]|nr:CoA pyrophosphatase [Acidobacteriota bacterium]MDH3786226.1 CoA pyrophosphatase [Acidobacteriota bacterium]
MRFDDYLAALAQAQTRPLPATDAQILMAPEPRSGWEPGRIPEDCRAGAALLVVFPIDGWSHLLLTKRASHLRHHPGQVAFPGGELDADESITEAARREAHEEVGISVDEVRVDATLTPLHVPVSRYAIHPVLAHLKHRPTLVAAPDEVAQILEIPLGELARPDGRKIDLRERGDQTHRVPYLDVAGERLWGATAMIVAEWLVWIGYGDNPWQRRQSSPRG